MDAQTHQTLTEGVTAVGPGTKKKSIFESRILFFAFVIAILVIAIWLRTGLLQYGGLFEPDGYYYYTAITQSAAHGFSYPSIVSLSGYPTQHAFGEDPMLIYATTIPYFFLQYLGFSLLSVMQWVPIFYGIAEAIAAYFLVRYLAKSRALGLLAMFFIATSSGNIARTAGTVYRGDTFVSLFIIVALILMLKIVQEKDMKRTLIYTAFTGFLVSAGMLIWTGGVIIPDVFFVATVLFTIFAFLIADRSALKKCLLLDSVLIIAFILNALYLAAWPNIVYSTLFSTPSFLVILIPVILATFFAYYLIDRKSSGTEPAFMKSLTKSLLSRTVFFLAVLVILAILLFAMAGNYLVFLVTNAHSIYSSGNIYSTTQELQPPSFEFLWSSFGLQLFLAPIGVLFFLFFAHIHGNSKYIRRGKITLNLDYGFVVLFAYLAIMAYLQGGAIRYNSMLSIPLALFSAYALYIGIRFFDEYSFNLSGTKIPVNAVYVGLIFALLLMQGAIAASQSFNSGPADGINPYFIQAMSWMHNNTPADSKVLALWPDGSVVEGVAQRQSFMDSVAGENGTRITSFSSWLLNTSPDTRYLTSNNSAGAWHPDYIVARYFWYQEIGGIAIEGNITQNLSEYGMSPLSSFTSIRNSSGITYEFSNTAYDAELRITQEANGTSQTIALFGTAGSGQLVQMRRIIFLNASNLNYQIINAPSNVTANYTLMLTYYRQNITGAQILGQKLPNTNMYKMLDLCSYSSCALSTPNVTAQLVYANGDTKIIHLTYH